MRALAVEIAIEVPDHGIGIEIRAIVEFHAAAQVEDPGLLVIGLLPLLRQPRNGLEVDVEVDHRAEEVEGDEPVEPELFGIAA